MPARTDRARWARSQTRKTTILSFRPRPPRSTGSAVRSASSSINRGNGRGRAFHDEGDYEAFVELPAESMAKTPMRVLGYCLMPNHFHLAVWPRADGDPGRWMRWLLTSHVRRDHRRYGSSGHVWQGRFKSFPVERHRPPAAERARGGREWGGGPDAGRPWRLEWVAAGAAARRGAQTGLRKKARFCACRGGRTRASVWAGGGYGGHFFCFRPRRPPAVVLGFSRAPALGIGGSPYAPARQYDGKHSANPSPRRGRGFLPSRGWHGGGAAGFRRPVRQGEGTSGPIGRGGWRRPGRYGCPS